MHDVTLHDSGGHRADGPAVGPAGYELGEEIGRGGMGVVYRARDLTLGREVAVKLLQGRFSPDSATAARFLEEARITGRLQHPGIPPIYQVGACPDGRPYLAMKLIRGQTLAELLKTGTPVDALAVFEAVSRAVGYAHVHGVIHRDLKPSNVMVGAFGEVQVMDWGLAKVLSGGGHPPREASADPHATADLPPDRDSGTPVTQAGSVIGTPAFMPPEQAAGEVDKVDRRSDVFGLGAVLCVLLTGKPPFEGKDAESVRLNAVRGRTEAAFARLGACGADPGLVALCRRCLAFDPADRPATADEVADAVAGLRRAAEDRARQAERDKLAALVRAAEQAKRRRATQRAAAAVAAVLLLGVAGTAAGLARADLRRREAESARQAEEAQRRLAEAKEAEANAVLAFVEERVFAAARPEGQEGGLGRDVTLRKALEKALPAVGSRFAEQPLVEARLRKTLGGSFWYLGEWRQAAEQFRRALDLYAGHRGPDHPDTLWAMTYLANTDAALGRAEEAFAIRRDVLARQKATLGPDHPNTLMSMHNLALSYAALGRHAEALALAEETLERRRATLGPDHPDTVWSLHNVADCCAALGQAERARRLRAEALARHEEKYGPDHPDTLISTYNLALSEAALGRHAEALGLRRETLARRKAKLGPDHLHTLRSLWAVADSYAALGRHAEALKLGEEALARRQATLGPDHPDTLQSLASVADSLCRLGRGAEAVPLLDECLRRAAGKAGAPALLSRVIDLRLRHFQGRKDPGGCRATAALWEALGRSDAASLYTAARLRAVAAAVAGAGPPARAEADRAMAWLRRAAAAGFHDRAAWEQDRDLDVLRPRADFRELVASLPEAARPRADE